MERIRIAGRFFDRAGSRPKVRDNVDLIVGDSEDTLTAFLASVKAPISFGHIDTDTYTPCRQVLEQIKPLLQCGSVILFDQLLGYLGYQEHELAAVDEIFDRRECDFIAFGVAPEKGNLVKAAIAYKE
ncbi:MAG TPA: class I SAM-dependent methyltransferase [Dehalococcoidia bacterium]|nr:class I SAM-dependent methyltransferase [Dehalococcoidia bacterium]